MVYDELAKWPDEGSTGGKTFAGSDFAKVKGSSGFGLPVAPSQEVRMRFEWSERNWPDGLKATRTVFEAVEVVSDFETKSVPRSSFSNESKWIQESLSWSLTK